MASISSITKAVSGLVSSQKGLQVTGHNISNMNTKGYTRQQLLQSDSSYLSIGKNGGYSMKVGLGVSIDEIRQIRSDLADRRLRTENSVLNYYQTLGGTTADIGAMFDEPYGNTLSDMINDLWAQSNKLMVSPSGVEERTSFLSTMQVLFSKVNYLSDSLETYQVQLNKEVQGAVTSINDIIDNIKYYNEKIRIEEASGQNANDYRDQRNLLLDELSAYGEVSYFEEPDHTVQVYFEGQNVVNKNIATHMKLIPALDTGSPFSIPVWEHTDRKVYPLEGTSREGDTGKLKALLLARGNTIVDENTSWDDIAINDLLSVDTANNAFVIPKIQKQLNVFTNHLSELLNKTFVGQGIGIHEGKQGVPVIIPKEVPDHLKKVASDILEGTPVTDDERRQYNALLIGGNVQVNPELLQDGGHNKLGTVEGDVSDKGDPTIINRFIKGFGESKEWYKDDTMPSAPHTKISTLKDYFSELVTEVGERGADYSAKSSSHFKSITNIENERASMGGVSQDEEFTNMLKYQYAYNASARMITMLDGMLDVVINKM